MNNIAERALRTAVQWRKISVGNQSDQGERFAELIPKSPINSILLNLSVNAIIVALCANEPDINCISYRLSRFLLINLPESSEVWTIGRSFPHETRSYRLLMLA